MNDLIRREDVIELLTSRILSSKGVFGDLGGAVSGVRELIKVMPPAEPEEEIIRCENCKWWDRLEDGHPYGYCRACRSGTHTERWEISIYRQNRYDFYCADAEPKENEDDDE